MPFILPTARYLMNQNASFNRGSFGGSISTGQKSAGNLPITQNAAQLTNNAPAGNFGGYYFGLSDQSGDVPEDLSVDALVLVSSFQFNAPNRIQVETRSNKGVVVRVASGSGNSPANFKEFFIGGSDTPVASAQAGPITICVDLSASGEDDTGGSFDPSNVTAWGFGTTKGNLVGTNSSLHFFQRV